VRFLELIPKSIALARKTYAFIRSTTWARFLELLVFTER